MIEGGGEGAVGHVGLHALGSFADRLGVPATLSAAVPWGGERAPLHDRGKVLTQAMLMLAGGGSSCADIEHLRVESRLFGFVASDSTTYRTFREVGPAVLADLHAAFAAVRRDVWARSSVTNRTGPVVLDIDASLVQIHSENKTGTSATYKGGFGFHPMFCFADATGETLASLLRPGNAGANDIADHLAVLDAAIAQLPERAAAGHRLGDDAGQVQRAVVVRTDSAGCTNGFVAGCRARNIGFCVVARRSAQIHSAILHTIGDDAWTPALTQGGDVRPRAGVIELTDRVDTTGWPEGTRLIVRREPLHPGAQRSLFDSETYRYWGHWTDQPGTPVELDVSMRAHARVEDHIRRLKASGLERFPFTDLDANKAWLATVAMAADLVRWFQLLCVTGPLSFAEPKTLRWRLWHTPARVIRKSRRHVIRLLDGWPDTTDILAAYGRIAALG
ncbi:MAG TPA: IS1380 family transposase [Microthrixaceae bacterium]|nr:IS1380 family transposase [Microthrixaceae bacterium]HMX08985.1 IS1380 family transposase [Microthrixaceae bacterium]